MEDKVLHNTLSQRMKSFYEEYFDRAPENRFEAFLAGGHRSLPVMLDCLESDEADSEARTDALIAIGRVFEEHGPTAEALDMVVAHAKRMSETGMGAERQAALFAIGRSRAETLIEGFLPLIESDKPDASHYRLSRGRLCLMGRSVDAIAKVARQKNPETIHAATWVPGKLRASPQSKRSSSCLGIL